MVRRRHWEPVKLRGLSPDRDKPFGIRERQWPQHDGINHTENSGRRADPQGEREHGHSGKTGVLQQLAEGKFQIVHGKEVFSGQWSVIEALTVSG